MRELPSALVGLFFLFVAGVVKAGEEHSADPELVLGFAYVFGGLGLIGVLAAGVAFGVRLAREG